MARHFSTKEFFRQMPNALLARYFQHRGILGDMNFAELPEAKPDRLLAAWLQIPDTVRHQMDAEFREIFDLSCEKGFKAIIDEAEWQLRDSPSDRTEFIATLSALANHSERAMVTFLSHPTFWKGATRFYHADSLPYWRKRKNFPHNPAAVDETSLRELASRIGGYFHNTEGRGKNCVVEPFRRGELDYFFAYPEDYSQQAVEWVEGQFYRRPHNPAFEVIFVYSQRDGSLDLNFRGANKTIEPLQGMFAETILKLEALPPDPKDERVYDLNPLRQKGFNFVFDIGSGIEAVTVKKLRLSSRIKSGDRITLEADTAENPNAVYDLLNQVGKSVPIHLYNVTLVELTASVKVAEDKPAKSVSIRITHPNSCSLKYDELDLKLREMLSSSGVEPKSIEAISPDDA